MEYLDIETWRDIIGYEGLYQISSHGRVKSVQRIVVNVNGRRTLYKERIMSAQYTKKGYKKIRIHKNCIGETLSIHRLVAASFVPKDNESKNTVNHINGIKNDNHFSNLEWVDNRENVSHGTIAKTGNPDKYIGVHWSDDRKRWVSQITICGKHVPLGRYKMKEDAIAAYKNALMTHGLKNKYQNYADIKQSSN